jgi:hypothetical protein
MEWPMAHADDTAGMTRPNLEDARLVLDRLTTRFFELQGELQSRDPEGRSLNLGATMFFGVWLSVIKDFDDRRATADAALGYSLQAGELLESIAARGPWSELLNQSRRTVNERQRSFRWFLDHNGKFAQWLERERQVYLAHTGRDGTLAGFQDHVRKVIAGNPALIEMALDDIADATFETPFWPPRPKQTRRTELTEANKRPSHGSPPETVKWSQIHDAAREEDSAVKNALVSWLASQDIPPGMAIGTMAELIADIAEKFLTEEERSKLADSLTLYLVTRLAPQRLVRKKKRLGLWWAEARTIGMIRSLPNGED